MPPRKTKVKSHEDRVQEYWTYIILCLILPLLPIFLEFLTNSGVVAVTTLTISAGFYAISVGTSSDHRIQFIFGFVLCIVFSCLFGMVSVMTKEGDYIFYYNAASLMAIVFMFVTHAKERHTRHIKEGERFWVW